MDSTGDDATREVILPPEILTTIFEIAASSSTQSAATLCRVAQWVQDVATPHLHAVCEVGIPIDRYDMDELMRRAESDDDGTISHSRQVWDKPALGRMIKGMWNAYDGSQLVRFLGVCPQVQHIALVDMLLFIYVVDPYANLRLSKSFKTSKEPLHLTLLRDPCLRGLTDYLQRKGTREFLHRITHMCLTISPWVSFGLSGLTDLTGLTHLALPCEAKHIPTVLAEMPHMKGLKVVVVIADPTKLSAEEVQEVTTAVLEHRKGGSDIVAAANHSEVEKGENGANIVEPDFFVLVEEVQNENQSLGGGRPRMREIWETEVRGGQTLWELAELQTKKLENEA